MEGAKVYAQDAVGQWQKATIIAALGQGRYRVQTEPWEDIIDGATGSSSSSGDFLEVDATSTGGALPFQNSNMPVNGFPNMTTLDHLHEAALLHNLRVRFFAGSCPYTYTADIVIAVNPYQWFPHLYTEEQRKEYLVFDRNRLAPHVYSTSSGAYAGLRESKIDQSILVSGESGAGKTETVKILMAHLALIASSDDSSHIKRIVESNPLLESFGNAQTVRNDNSSRFGKFIELQLNGKCCLIGSKCRTYLLEKSRVVGQDAGERNYHIFYQMLSTSPETRATFGLNGASRTRDIMRYTSMGASKTEKIEGKTDLERFEDTVAALALVGVEGDTLASLLRGLAGVLLLGQVDFVGCGDGDGDEAAKLKDDEARTELQAVAAQLDVDAEALELALTKRTIKTRNEIFVKALSPAAAESARDALAKELYARLFDWLVGCICTATAAPAGESKHYVGLLDIFGFESFAINRFEQLCINYANEKLQQKFTHDVFKAVQQEYSEEGIPWDKIEFKDNAPVLALIESRMGIIAMLNEECVRPKGSDVNFVSKLSTVHKADPAYSTPKLGKQKELQFSVLHYAGGVTYTTSGWLERNKDTISDDVIGLLRSSNSSLLPGLFAEVSNEGGGQPKKAGADTVATKFKESLAQLMDTIGRTTTQYVRCLKPNKNKTPAEMDNGMVLEQLRCAGVIEAIRISRAGFPARMPLSEFVHRFGVLARAASPALKAATNGSTNHATICRSMLTTLTPDAKDSYEVGKTRVYFKLGVLESLEERRALLLQAKATEIARRVRGQQSRRRYLKVRHAIIRLQAAQRRRVEQASYLQLRGAVIFCQSLRRSVIAKRRVLVFRRERAATKIQACFRGRVALQSFDRARRAAIRIQSMARRVACRRQYLIDLADSKEQAKLENQIKALQAKLEAQERAFREASATSVAAPVVTAATAPVPAAQPAESEQSVQLLEALNALTAENSKLRAENEKQRKEIIALRQENQQLRASHSTRKDWTSWRQSNKQTVANAKIESTQRQRVRSGSIETRRQTSDVGKDISSSDFSSGNSSPSQTPTRGQAIQVNPAVSQFWEDVPFDGLPYLLNCAEIHIKLGTHILTLDDSGKTLVWRQRAVHGYRRSMAFLIERRDPGAPLGEDCAEEDTNVGVAFALKSALTSKYVVFDRQYLRATGARPEDASIFMFVPPLAPAMATAGDNPGGASGRGAKGLEAAVARWREEEGVVSQEYSCALRLFENNKMMCLAKEGFVTCVDVSCEKFRYDTMAAVIEYLRPVPTYEVTIEEEHIGILLEKELPLRVAEFKPVRAAAGQTQPGPAERTGRVHIGDTITRVNGQDISGIPLSDVVPMIGCKRPVTLGFAVVREHSGLVQGRSPEKKPATKKRSSFLFDFGKRKSEAASEI